MERNGNDGRLRALRAKVARWRRTRLWRSPMPAELWAQAVELARTAGTFRVARALPVDYGALARRVATAEPAPRAGGGLIELRGADLLGGGTVVEVTDPDGARLTIRQAGALDAASLVGAFRRRAP